LRRRFAAAALAGGAPARADVITLNVSASFTPIFEAACSPTCMLGGDIVINNSTGAAKGGFVSANVTATGFVPGVGPFMNLQSFGPGGLPPVDNTQLVLESAPFVLPLDTLTLLFLAPTEGSFVGYTGGQLVAGELIHVAQTGESTWGFASGSFTPVPAPVIGNGLPLLLVVVGLLFGSRLAA
jgi:hypothetical protein